MASAVARPVLCSEAFRHGSGGLGVGLAIPSTLDAAKTLGETNMQKLLLSATFLLIMGVGTAQASVNVPDGGTTLGLMTGALIGLGILRRKFRG